MSTGILHGIGICGMVCALPKNMVNTIDHTDHFEQKVLEDMIKETGVVSTYRTSEKQTASDLCYEAAEELIRGLDWRKESLGALVFVSHAMDYQRPATSGVIQSRLGLDKECFCIDINLGCSGFVYGISVLGSIMASMKIDRALLVCGDLSSKAVDPATTSNLLFGDVGAAIALEKKADCSDIHFSLLTDGSRYKKIFMRGGGFRHPEDKENLYADMVGMDVLAFSISDVPKTMISFMKDYEIEMEDIDLVALHQANALIINRILKKVKAPKEKVPVVLGKYGNSSSSSIPLVICDHVKETGMKKMHVLACGFGIGLSWGVADFIIPEYAYVNMIETGNWFDDDNGFTVEGE